MAPETARELESRIDGALAAGEFEKAERWTQDYLRESGTPPVELAGRSLWFRARYLATQTALATGQLHQVVARAGELLPFLADLPEVVASRIYLLLAEAHARLGNRSQARVALTCADAARETLTRNLLLRLRELRVRLMLGELRTCAEAVQECVQQLLAVGESSNAVLLLSELGRAYEAGGELDLAETCWQSAANLISNGTHDFVRVDVSLQCGRLAHLKGRFQEALDCYTEADQLVPRDSPQSSELHLRRLLVRLDLNQIDRVREEFRSLHHTRMGNWPEELRGLVSTTAILCGEQTHPAASARDETLGYAAASRGDRLTARRAYRRALDVADAPQRRARLNLALGLLWLADDPVEAAKHLTEAETEARSAGMEEVLWRALDGRGRLAQHAANDVAARELFEEAVGLSERQAAQFRNVADAGGYRLHRAGALRLLLAGAAQRGDPDAVFHFQELERGRLLLDLWRTGGRPMDGLPEEVATLERLIDLDPKQTDLRIRLNRLLEDHLLDRDRDARTVPLPTDLTRLRRRLGPTEVYLAASLVEDDLVLLAVRSKHATVCHSQGGGSILRRQAANFRLAVQAAVESYHRGGAADSGRIDLDRALEELGTGSLGVMVREALEEGATTERVLWAADDELHGIPLGAVRYANRYLVENYCIANTFGGAWLTQNRILPSRRWGNCLVVTEGSVDSPDGAAGLPEAQAEGQAVAASFLRSAQLHAERATRAMVQRSLAQAKVVHFACHALFDAESPLGAFIRLPSGERIRAAEVPDLPLDGIRLVTLSACHSGRVGQVVGREVFGLVTGFLAAGVRTVIAGLWAVPDAETAGFMANFYRHRLATDLATALTMTQREVLASGASSPLTWAVFTLYGEPGSLPIPAWWARPWARWRQRRHARIFPGITAV
jgi:tetratricopeptide (TPR) repeat protein